MKPQIQPSVTAHAAAIKGAPLYVVEYAPLDPDRLDGSRWPAIPVPIIARAEAEVLAARQGAPMHAYTPREVRAAVRAWRAS